MSKVDEKTPLVSKKQERGIDDGEAEGGPDQDLLKFVCAPHCGLTQGEADALFKKFGPNELPEKKTPKWIIFLLLFVQPMPIMIWIASCKNENEQIKIK